MNWTAKPHPVETLIECIAPIPLALAAGWACLQLGVPLVQGAAIGFATMTMGFAAVRIIGGMQSEKEHGFAPVEFPAANAELDELLLTAADELLELDDPLVEPAPQSRVVRLFAKQEPTPGELVARIEDFLGDGRRPPASPLPDASAALQAALANVRSSLR